MTSSTPPSRDGPIQAGPDGGVRVHVRLTPAGGADRIDGLAVDAAGEAFLKARVRAAPEDGAANAALVGLLAKALGVPKSAVRIERGHTARVKLVAAAGIDVETARRRLTGEGP